MTPRKSGDPAAHLPTRSMTTGELIVRRYSQHLEKLGAEYDTDWLAREIQQAIEAEREACAAEPLNEECEEGECIHNSERACHAFAIRARSSEPAKSGEKE